MECTSQPPPMPHQASQEVGRSGHGLRFQRGPAAPEAVVQPQTGQRHGPSGTCTSGSRFRAHAPLFHMCASGPASAPFARRSKPASREPARPPCGEAADRPRGRLGPAPVLEFDDPLKAAVQPAEFLDQRVVHAPDGPVELLTDRETGQAERNCSVRPWWSSRSASSPRRSSYFSSVPPLRHQCGDRTPPWSRHRGCSPVVKSPYAAEESTMWVPTCQRSNLHSLLQSRWSWRGNASSAARPPSRATPTRSGSRLGRTVTGRALQAVDFTTAPNSVGRGEGRAYRELPRKRMEPNGIGAVIVSGALSNDILRVLGL